MKFKTLFTAAAIAVGAFCGTAQAAPVLGSHVDSAVFASTIGSTAGWSYLGLSTSPFIGAGVGELEIRGGNFLNSFGYARTNHTGAVEVFGPTATIGSTASIAGYSPGYIFYLQGDAPIDLIDSSRQWTDGANVGGVLGFVQGNLDIFQNASSNSWAFFFDDGGPSGFRDDNDYDDLVVTFRQVPAPGALSLLVLGLVGLGAGLRRRKA